MKYFLKFFYYLSFYEKYCYWGKRLPFIKKEFAVSNRYSLKSYSKCSVWVIWMILCCVVCYGKRFGPKGYGYGQGGGTLQSECFSVRLV